MAVENEDCLNIEDVYKEPRFNSVDFPGVVRSILCLPIFLRNAPVGFLILSHSLPNFFHDNHIRVLKILGSLVAHMRLLHPSDRLAPLPPPQPAQDEGASEKPDVYAVVLIGLDTLDSYGRRIPLETDSVRDVRKRIQKVLEEKESVLCYGERELLVFMPGVSSELLATRVRVLREAFYHWQAARWENRRNVGINLGFSVCEGAEDLARTLEVAALVMHPDTGEDSEVLNEA